jgi:MFS family permease
MLAHVTGWRQKLTESASAFRGNFSNPQLRRLQLAGIGSVVGQWAYSIAVSVYAYEAGGAKAVAVVTLVRTIPAAVAAPFLATLADRLPRIPVMSASSLGSAIAVAAAGVVVLSDGPSWAVYALAGASSILGTLFLPAESALLPDLARDPEELTAANVTRSTIESVGSFVGPAIGGLLLAATSAGVVFIAAAATFVWEAAIVSLIRPPAKAPVEADEEPSPEGVLRSMVAGFKAIAIERRLRLVIALYSAQTLLAGALGVLVVVTALELLDAGESGVGLLNAASGIGGIVGALGAFALIGRKRLASDFGLGIVLFGAPLAVIGAWPNTAVALLALGVLGLGNTLVDVAGLTLLQRTAPPAVIGRVFGVLEMLLVGTIGLGAVLAPALIAWVGIRWSLVVTGAVLPVLAAATWRKLLQIDAESKPPAGVELLAKIPIFAPLPLPAIERLASQLAPVEMSAGTAVIRQGDHGDRFYVVESGRFEVIVDGTPSGELEAGDFFGEIALLRDVPRTATVQALTDGLLQALGRHEFLEAVTGHPPSARAADAVVGARLDAALVE